VEEVAVVELVLVREREPEPLVNQGEVEALVAVVAVLQWAVWEGCRVWALESLGVAAAWLAASQELAAVQELRDALEEEARVVEKVRRVLWEAGQRR
jgi:hypothetical protein